MTSAWARAVATISSLGFSEAEAHRALQHTCAHTCGHIDDDALAERAASWMLLNGLGIDQRHMHEATKDMEGEDLPCGLTSCEIDAMCHAESALAALAALRRAAVEPEPQPPRESLVGSPVGPPYSPAVLSQSRLMHSVERAVAPILYMSTTRWRRTAVPPRAACNWCTQTHLRLLPQSLAPAWVVEIHAVDQERLTLPARHCQCVLRPLRCH